MLFYQELPDNSKKLVSVLAASVPVTDSNKKVVKVLCIYYLVQFQKEQVRALLNSGSKVNTINFDYAQKLKLKIQKTNIGAQKIDGSALEIFEMVIADFQMQNKASKPRFFQETFLVANTKFKVILGMLFLKISNADMLIGEKTLTQKSYTTNKALPTTKQVQIVDPKEFVIVVLDIDSKMFMMYMAIQEREEMPMHYKKQT